MRTTAHLVDVIIPTRNRPGMTLEAIRSVQAQTATSWHLIVVDDASDDGSLSELHAMVDADARITLIERPVRGGAQSARQIGFAVCTAPFVATLDSDDLWEPKKLEEQLARFWADQDELPRLGAVLCGHEWSAINGDSSATRRPRVRGPANPMAARNMSTLLATRDALLKAGGYIPTGQRPLPIDEGIELSIRLSQACDFTAVEKVLVHCRNHRSDRNSNGFTQSGVGAEALAHIVKVHSSILERYPNDLARLMARAGARFMASGRLLTGLAYLASSVAHGDLRTRLKMLWRYGPFALRTVLVYPFKRRRLTKSGSVVRVD